MRTTKTPEQRQPLLVVESRSERSFRIGPVETEGDVVSASMRTGPCLNGPAGRPVGGAVGVLIDNVLGYAIMLDRPVGQWSVSSEISVDLCGPIPTDGSSLLAEARIVHSDTSGGISSGTVVDDQGRLVACCRQHGRWVRGLPAMPRRDDGSASTDMQPRAADLLDILGTQVKATDAGAELDLVATTELVNPLGNLHGGMALCASDVVAHAALEGAGPSFDTASVHIAYARPVPLGTAVRFKASVAHSGRSFAVVNVTAVNGDGKPCTIATVTAAARGRE